MDLQVTKDVDVLARGFVDVIDLHKELLADIRADARTLRKAQRKYVQTGVGPDYRAAITALDGPIDGLERRVEVLLAEAKRVRGAAVRWAKAMAKAEAKAVKK
jgi:hypothetical protein